MNSERSIIAIAIEDRVDFWYEDALLACNFSDLIREGGEYFDSVKDLITEALSLLISTEFAGRSREIFNCLDAICVSIPGVVDNNRTLVQMPMWNFPTAMPRIVVTANGATAVGIDICDLVADLVGKVIVKDGCSWGQRERERFKKKVFVVNDATACAAFEYSKRMSDASNSDFVYIKAHNGVNAGVVERTDRNRFQIKTMHAEAGHVHPILHILDEEVKYSGVCQFHGNCFEGLVSSHSFVDRARNPEHPLYPTWSRQLEVLEQRLGGDSDLKDRPSPAQDLDREFVHAVLGGHSRIDSKNLILSDDVIKWGIDLTAHYLGQLVHSIMVGPLVPSAVILGGRMAKPRVIDQIRAKVVDWCNDYPWRPSLRPEAIEQHIIPSCALDSEIGEIELKGALAIAKGRAALPLNWGGTRVPLPLTPNSANASGFERRKDDVKPVASPSNVIKLTLRRRKQEAEED